MRCPVLHFKGVIIESNYFAKGSVEIPPFKIRSMGSTRLRISGTSEKKLGTAEMKELRNHYHPGIACAVQEWFSLLHALPGGIAVIVGDDRVSRNALLQQVFFHLVCFPIPLFAKTTTHQHCFHSACLIKLQPFVEPAAQPGREAPSGLTVLPRTTATSAGQRLSVVPSRAMKIAERNRNKPPAKNSHPEYLSAAEGT
jgi:hypothetical protein